MTELKKAIDSYCDSYKDNWTSAKIAVVEKVLESFYAFCQTQNLAICPKVKVTVRGGVAYSDNPNVEIEDLDDE